ncbi:MAG: M48 family metalloprotease [Lewinellaceae bacterium]|nr:M48 family metalloprotease [Phaeodactylibacter sp.]MCB9036201.1 M48 family metalloprotease [Lewinellaceae bacterium]
MSTITHWIDTSLAEALGWALLHSLWQGAAIALLLAAGLILARSLSSGARYWMALAALLALLTACIGTFAWMYEPRPGQAAATEDATLSFSDAQEALPPAYALATAEAATDHPTVLWSYFEQHLPLLVTGWLLGVLLLSLRMLGEVAYIQHLRHYRCRQPEGAWLEKLAQMKERMGIRRQVGLRETYRIHSPMVVGVFRQVILLPMGLLSGLSPEQVEAVLAHELAHVRRNDYLVNLLVSLAEILLFFNPMMWWISKKIRAEREHACDDLAVEMTGDTLSLVRSLALMEEWRLHGTSSLSMAFLGKDGSVLSRMQRLLQRNDKRQVAAKAFWSLSICCVCLALLAFQSSAGQVAAAGGLSDGATPVEQPQPKREAAIEVATELPAVAEEDSPEPDVQPAIPRAEPQEIQSDTIPAEARAIEKDIRQLEEKMRASEMELRKKEQALRKKELEIRKETQQALQARRKALLELEMQIRNKEYEREMQENEFEIAEHELEAAQMELEEQQQALHLQEEQIEQAQGQELQQKLKAFQEAQRQVMEKQKALELRAFEAQKKQRQQGYEKEKAIQELQNRRFQMEQEVEMQEQEMEFKMMGLHHEMQQLEVEQRMVEKELEAKHREFEERMMKLEEREDE